MIKFNSLGELFIAYRKYNHLSQLDFAHNLNVDVRTVQRWEKDITLVKPEKEEDIVLQTLLPYQLIRNLNATVPIATFYDFNIRKYSLTERSNDLPDATWFKSQINIATNRLRKIDFEYDINHIVHFIDTKYKDLYFVNKDLVKEAIRLLPDLNLVLIDDSGYYSGHCIILPLKESSYLKLRNRELSKNQLGIKDLTDYRTVERPVFFNYDITADCNDNFFYILSAFLRFFRDCNKIGYLSCAYTDRYDSVKLSKQSGLKVIWEDTEIQEKLGLKYPPRFAEGNFKDFLSDLE